MTVAAAFGFILLLLFGFILLLLSCFVWLRERRRETVVQLFLGHETRARRGGGGQGAPPRDRRCSAPSYFIVVVLFVCFFVSLCVYIALSAFSSQPRSRIPRGG